MTLAQGAARAVNKILLELCVKSTKALGEPLREYFYTGAVGYGLCPSSGQEGVESACRARWPPAGSCHCRSSRRTRSRAGRRLRRPRPAAPGYRSGSSRCTGTHPDVSGDRPGRCPRAALGQYFQHSHPPIIINITDGMVTDSPYRGRSLAVGKQLTSIRRQTARPCCSTSFCRPAWPRGVVPRPWVQPSGARPGPVPDQQHAAPKDVDNARGAQIQVQPGSRGLVFNADLATLVKFLEIGTRFDVQDR